MPTELATEDEALDRAGQWSHWLLRLAFAGVFLYMGIDKFMGGGISEFSEMMELPYLIGLLVALAEVGGGSLVIIGAFTNAWVTRLGALMGVVVLLGAIVMVHWGQWHFMPTATHPMGGLMFQVTLTYLALYLFIRGNQV
ncbi:MAG: DoxX family protein [Pseudomonadales bacterium]